MGDVAKEMHAWKVRIGHEQPIFRTRVPVPKPSEGFVLIKILAAGACHSDCTIRDAKDPFPGWSQEFVLGHEGAGEIVELGPGVNESQFKVGDRVATLIIPGCNKCDICQQGHQRLCKEAGDTGYGLGVDGMFAEFVTVKASGCVRVPEQVSIEQAAVAPDAVLTAYHAVVKRAEVKPDQTVAVFGLGGLGLNAVQILLHLGVKRILVVDQKQSAIDQAIQFGIPREDAFCSGNASAKQITEVVAEKGILVDIAFEFVGHEATIMAAQATVRMRGMVVLVGLFSMSIPIIPLYMCFKEITIKGHYNGDLESLKEVLDLIAKGVLKPKIQTTSIENVVKVLEDLDAGKIDGRMVMKPDWKDI